MYNKVNELKELFEKMGMNVTVRPIYKGNVEYTGVSFNFLPNNVSPTLYVENYDNTEDVVELAKQMVNTLYNNDNFVLDAMNIAHITPNISNWDWAKERLVVCVEPKNASEDIVKRDFLDLQMIVRCVITEDENGIQSTKVTPSLLKAWNITEDDLFIKAKENTEKEIRVGNMLDTLFGNGAKTSIDNFEPIVDKNDITMFVFTNKSGVNGAGGFACKSALKKLANKFNSGFYILPSSIHELLVIPVETNDELMKNRFTEMVQEVNAGEVKPEERLSNHCYYYNRVTEEIEL